MKYKKYLKENTELEKITPDDFVKKLKEVVKNAYMELENKYNPGVKFDVMLSINTVSDIKYMAECNITKELSK